MTEDATKNAVEFVYWVGYMDKCSIFNNNPYLMTDNEGVVLFAPSSTSFLKGGSYGR